MATHRAHGLKFSGLFLNSADSNSFLDLFSVYLKAIDHINLKLLIFVGILQVLGFDLKKVQDFGNFETDQTGQMRRLIEVFDGCTCQFVILTIGLNVWMRKSADQRL